MAEAAVVTKGPTLHHLNNSQSQRILWLCEELHLANGFEYTVVHHFRDKKTIRAPPALAKIHPLGKSPILVTADGRVIVESSVIASYLLKTYDTGNNFVTEDWIQEDSLVSYAGTSLGLVMMFEMFLNIMVQQTPWPISYLVRVIRSGVKKQFTTAELKKSFEYLERELGDQDWFNGSSPGRSDFVISWPLDMISSGKMVNIDKDYPKIAAWRERVLNRPAWKSGLTKGNGYNLAFAG